MKLSSLLPEDQAFWYVNAHDIQPLQQDLTTDVVIIGGGMAGLSAAQNFASKGYKVVLLEKNYCGSGASGKSSGFITPNSELSLNGLIAARGAPQAEQLWDLVSSGVELIGNNIVAHALDCDYIPLDTCEVANTQRAFRREIEREHAARLQCNYDSTLYTQQQISALLNSSQFKGAVIYKKTFGINAFRYCAGMKQVLKQMGVQIYEETPVVDIKDKLVTTTHYKIQAEHIIVCTDRFTPLLNVLADKLYQVQTFILLSAPLTTAQIGAIFPDRPLMVWDTDLIYHYFRLTGENRLILGGANILYTYTNHETHRTRVPRQLMRYFNAKFPQVSPQFEYVWPGLIGVSKDLLPIAGFDATMPSVYYVAAATGLPWAAALGHHSAERIVNNNRSYDEALSPYRSFPLGSGIQCVLGKQLTFALSHFLTAGSI